MSANINFVKENTKFTCPNETLECAQTNHNEIRLRYIIRKVTIECKFCFGNSNTFWGASIATPNY